MKSKILEFDNLIKENQNKAKELNIGSNKLVLEMNEDNTKYKVSRVEQPNLNSRWGISRWEKTIFL